MSNMGHYLDCPDFPEDQVGLEFQAFPFLPELRAHRGVPFRRGDRAAQEDQCSECAFPARRVLLVDLNEDHTGLA